MIWHDRLHSLPHMAGEYLLYGNTEEHGQTYTTTTLTTGRVEWLRKCGRFTQEEDHHMEVLAWALLPRLPLYPKYLKKGQDPDFVSTAERMPEPGGPYLTVVETEDYFSGHPAWLYWIQYIEEHPEGGKLYFDRDCDSDYYRTLYWAKIDPPQVSKSTRVCAICKAWNGFECQDGSDGMVFGGCTCFKTDIYAKV